MKPVEIRVVNIEPELVIEATFENRLPILNGDPSTIDTSTFHLEDDGERISAERFLRLSDGLWAQWQELNENPGVQPKGALQQTLLGFMDEGTQFSSKDELMETILDLMKRGELEEYTY